MVNNATCTAKNVQCYLAKKAIETNIASSGDSSQIGHIRYPPVLLKFLALHHKKFRFRVESCSLTVLHHYLYERRPKDRGKIKGPNAEDKEDDSLYRMMPRTL
uniref:Uncharacterized protein n=1 Tax=Rhizophagus irregularis (strain DAOM 181602 / DAOM 197198 / MUCL 43194) TaxID=747089 RepID=U9U6U4_RHIID